MPSIEYVTYPYNEQLKETTSTSFQDYDVLASGEQFACSGVYWALVGFVGRSDGFTVDGFSEGGDYKLVYDSKYGLQDGDEVNNYSFNTYASPSGTPYLMSWVMDQDHVYGPDPYGIRLQYKISGETVGDGSAGIRCVSANFIRLDDNFIEDVDWTYEREIDNVSLDASSPSGYTLHRFVPPVDGNWLLVGNAVLERLSSSSAYWQTELISNGSVFSRNRQYTSGRDYYHWCMFNMFPSGMTTSDEVLFNVAHSGTGDASAKINSSTFFAINLDKFSEHHQLVRPAISGNSIDEYYTKLVDVSNSGTYLGLSSAWLTRTEKDEYTINTISTSSSGWPSGDIIHDRLLAGAGESYTPSSSPDHTMHSYGRPAIADVTEDVFLYEYYNDVPSNNEYQKPWALMVKMSTDHVSEGVPLYVYSEEVTVEQSSGITSYLTGCSELTDSVDLFLSNDRLIYDDFTISASGLLLSSSYSTSLHISGVRSENFDASLYVKGYTDTTNSLNLFISENYLFYDDLNVSSNGLILSSNDNNTLYMHGYGASTDSVDLFITDNRLVYDDFTIHGSGLILSSNYNTSLNINGCYEQTSGVPLYSVGSVNVESGVALHILSFLEQSSGIPLHTTNFVEQSSGIPLYVEGYSSTTDALDLFISDNYLLYDDLNVNSNGLILSFNNDATLHINGHYQQTSGVPLYSVGSIIVESGASLYTGGLLEHPSGISLYVDGIGCTNDSFDCFLYNNPETDNVALVLKGTASIITSDSFDRNDNADLLFTDTYNGGSAYFWQENKQEALIKNNRMGMVGDTFSIVDVNRDITDVGMWQMLRFNFPLGKVGVIPRYFDNYNFYLVCLSYIDQQLQLYEKVSNTFRQIDSQPFDIVVNRDYNLSIDVYERELVAVVTPGFAKITYSEFDLFEGSTKCGLYSEV